MKKILFICTGNSARSIMAEALMNRHGRGSFKAYSAGANPSGVVNPLTLEVLASHGHRTDELSSKSLREFTGDEFDTVVTVCDKARESCPVWPGKTEILHWSIPDPAAFNGGPEQKRSFFEKIYSEIEIRIRDFLGSD